MYGCIINENKDNRFDIFVGDADVILGAEGLRYAAQSIGKITGQIGVEDVLDVIFRDFCIGK